MLNRNKKILTLFCASVLFLSTPLVQAATLPSELKGVPYYQSLIYNATYTDTQGHWAEEALYIAGIFGLLKSNQGQIRPDEALTRREALLALANLGGTFEEVQKNQGDNQRNQNASVEPLTLWGQRLIEAAAQQGLFEGFPQAQVGPQSPYWDEAITREEMALWTTRTLQLEPIYGTAQAHIYNFDDWQSINGQTLPYLERALQYGLINGIAQNDRFYMKPQQEITRAQSATIFLNSLPRALEQQERSVFAASIDDIDQIQEGPGGAIIRRLHITTTTGEMRSIVLSGPHKDSPRGQDIAIWKKGPADSRALQPGDQIEIYPATASAKQEGTVSQSAPGEENQRIIDNPSVPEHFLNTDIPMDIHLIRVLQSNSTLEGLLMDYDAGTGYLILQNDQGQLQHGYVMAGATVQIGAIYRKIEDIPNGTYLTARAVADRIVAITADLPTMHPGAIPEGSKVQEGRIRAIEARGLQIVDAEGREVYYPFAPALEVRQGQELARLQDLRIGDPVILRFSTYQGYQIARIEIPKANRLVEDVYRGTIGFINPITKVATLRNVYKYSGSRWQVQPGQVQVRVSPVTSLVLNNQVLSADTFLRVSPGQSIIFSAANNFDGLRASQLALLSSEGAMINDRIRSLDIVGGSLRLQVDGNYLHIDNNTIVLRDGRLTDIKDLEEGDSIMAYVDVTRSGYRAAFIETHKDIIWTEQSSDGLVQGSLLRIRADGEMELQRYSRHRNNSWENFSSGSRRFYIQPSRDTQIYDFRGLIPTTIPISDFLTQGAHGQYNGSYIQSFVQAGRPLVITLHNTAPQPERAPLERTSLARINSLNPQSQTIIFREVQDWSDASQRWTSNPVTLSLHAEEAVIIQNDRIIPFHQLRPNTKVLLIRDPQTNEVRFIFVQ
ncbi:S-layer homology domain-containing protein [Heliorestis convoluta]|uniref:SLH domain-containing protein n=1 Tax=Heliorestis convoluta TaxID=356322 RepID=A0A5Q2MXN3_9FIRM|nr:S-layer homology domain-containing protein [Heliorestis convoluta]QGG47524.1 hypothetical protein FTV88_1377 [Heliorestis convoluta]